MKSDSGKILKKAAVFLGTVGAFSSLGGILLTIGQFSFAFQDVRDNHYLQHKMFHLGAHSLYQPLLQWGRITLVLFFVLLVFWVFWESLRVQVIKNSFKAKNWPVLAGAVLACLTLFFFGVRNFHAYIFPPDENPWIRIVIWGLLCVLVGLGRVLSLARNGIVQVGIRFSKIFLTGVAVIMVLVCLTVALFLRFQNPSGPNVIVLLVDALRKDHVSKYGYYRNTTPKINRFARKAVVFRNAVSQCSWTSPAIASLFSSLYPSVHGLTSYSYKENVAAADTLDFRLVTFAEVLKEKGYATGAFVANHWINRQLGYGQGFDIFDPILYVPKPRAWMVNEKALKWIAANQSKPFFAYMHYMDVHGPYAPPGNFSSFFKSEVLKKMTEEDAVKIPGFNPEINDLNHYIDQYDGEIRYIDRQIGVFLDKIRELGLMDNTIIIITSDHGEAFLEHGYGDHGWSLYNEEIDIPLIIKLPEGEKFPEIKQHRVQLIDVAATVLGLLHFRFPYEVDGWDLSREFDRKSLLRRVIVSEELSEKITGPPKVAMIKDGYKVIFNFPELQVRELYDLEKDKREMKNLINHLPEKLDDFSQVIIIWEKAKIYARQKLGLSASVVEIKDKKEIERLKSLGYLK